MKSTTPNSGGRESMPEPRDEAYSAYDLEFEAFVNKIINSPMAELIIKQEGLRASTGVIFEIAAKLTAELKEAREKGWENIEY